MPKDMHIPLLPIFLVAGVLLLVFVQSDNFKVKGLFVKNSTDALSEANSLSSPSPVIDPSPSVVLSPSPKALPTPISSANINQNVNINHQSSNNSSQNGQTVNINDFQYPNSSKTSSSDKKMTLQSNDNPTTITDWYKNKIRSINMNTKSFVTTTTNGVVKNELVGSSGDVEIRIKIDKGSSQSLTNIEISLS